EPARDEHGRGDPPDERERPGGDGDEAAGPAEGGQLLRQRRPCTGRAEDQGHVFLVFTSPLGLGVPGTEYAVPSPEYPVRSPGNWELCTVYSVPLTSRTARPARSPPATVYCVLCTPYR